MFSQVSVNLSTGVSGTWADTPRADIPRADTPPPCRLLLQHMVRILLECILGLVLFSYMFWGIGKSNHKRGSLRATKYVFAMSFYDLLRFLNRI